MNEDKFQVPKDGNKVPTGRVKKFLKIVGKCFLGLIIGIVVLVIVLVLVAKFSPTYTDHEGIVWQKYEGDKSTPTFTVFGEQGGVDQTGKTPRTAKIKSYCDPNRFDFESDVLKGDYAKGIARPNHCVVASSSISNDPSLDTYLLLPDGSLISLAGSSKFKIQVNINDDGIKIVQAEGKAYYHIQKQATGKQFIVQAGDQTFTAIGTDIVVVSSGSAVAERSFQMAVVKGSVKFAAVGQGILSRFRKVDTKGTTIKERQKVEFCPKYAFTCIKKKYPKSVKSNDKHYTISPLTTADNNALIMNKFYQKQTLIFIIVFSRDLSLDQIIKGLQQVLATVQKNNQQDVDRYLAEQRAISEARIKHLRDSSNSSSSTSKGSSGSTSGGTSTPSCSAGSHLEAHNFCCPNGTYLATNHKCYKKGSSTGSSGSSSGSGSSTNEQCSPPGSATYQLMCESSHRGQIKNGQCCVAF